MKKKLRRLGFDERRRALIEERAELAELFGQIDDIDYLNQLSELMIESPLGVFGLPLGLATGFVIDGESLALPLATEEPSVIAAASFAAGLVARAGGFSTSASGDIVTAQIWLEGLRLVDLKNFVIAEAQGSLSGPWLSQDLSLKFKGELEGEFAGIVQGALPGMARRGGGYLRASLKLYQALPGIALIRLDLSALDAMGANLANTAAEALAPRLEELFGGRALARILTNQSEQRLARASFSLPTRYLRRAGQAGQEIARRIVLLTEIARQDRGRAVTHNKGILNGVTALSLATGNDTRAIEAAAHLRAGESGTYLPLTEYRLDGERLFGEITLPVPLGTVSSTAGLHPGARLSLEILGRPSAKRLGRIAAALGLAQNLAALAALVGEGIQVGHMRLHARRTAWLAGARGAEIEEVAERISRGGQVNQESARKMLEIVRDGLQQK